MTGAAIEIADLRFAHGEQPVLAGFRRVKHQAHRAHQRAHFRHRQRRVVLVVDHQHDFALRQRALQREA